MEHWKKINSVEADYYVSSLGNIKRFNKSIDRLLTPRKHTSGYSTVCLTVKGGYVYKYIHRLVAEAFLDTYRANLVVNHLDGDKKNNSLINLECCTQRENLAHGRRTGLIDINVENSNTSKLTWVQVNEIRQLRHLPRQELSDKFNVTKATVSRILSYKIWKV